MGATTTALTQARLRGLLDYDQATGVFIWRVAAGRRAKVGSGAGGIDNKGYRRIKIDGRYYAEHRLAFLWMTGEFPTDQVDHINGDRADNHWENLRPATGGENKQNIGGARRNNKSGLLGASWNKRDKKWLAQIKLNGRSRNLGRFPTPEEAHAVYMRAKRELHPFSARLKEAA